MSHAITPDEWLVSIDDHLIEPLDLWTSRLPRKYHDVCPQVREDEKGEAWFYEDNVRFNVTGLVCQAGRHPREIVPAPLSYSEIEPYCYDPTERLMAMNRDGVLTSMSFPNLPKFGGQLFSQGKDRELGMLCIQAYNDFILDEWSATAPERLVAAVIMPYWDPLLAARELERCAGKGAKTFAFTDHPRSLGYPSIHDAERYWDPIWSVANDSDLTVSIHFVSSAHFPDTGPDAPPLILPTIVRWVAAQTCSDWIFCDVFNRFPNLRISLSEGGIAWMPLVVEAAKHAVDHYEYFAHWGIKNLQAVGFEKLERTVEIWPHGDKSPLDVYRDHIRACFVAGLGSVEETEREVLQRYGADLFLGEADFPHHDSTYPNTLEKWRSLLEPFSHEDRRRLLQDNAIEWYRLDGDLLRQRARELSEEVE